VFTRRWSGAGSSGIGLALARDLVREAGGDLSLASRHPTRFEAVVPAALSG
jgi:signal transduction histidine kinase